jgi:hypothetical protein
MADITRTSVIKLIHEIVNEKLTAAVFPRLSRIEQRQSLLKEKQRELEHRMTTAEDTAWAQLGALIGVVVAEVQSLKDGIAQKDAALQDALAALQAAQADNTAEVEQAVSDALAADSAGDTTRTLDYLQQLSAAAPVDVPVVPVPEPGEPATPPEDLPTDDGGDSPVA